jgi:hypothetical protein
MDVVVIPKTSSSSKNVRGISYILILFNVIYRTRKYQRQRIHVPPFLIKSDQSKRECGQTLINCSLIHFVYFRAESTLQSADKPENTATGDISESSEDEEVEVDRMDVYESEPEAQDVSGEPLGIL